MQKAQEFICQEYALRKKRNPNFSLRAFARWLDISPGQLSQMMTGKRTITPETLKKIGQRLGLSPAEKKLLMSSLMKDHGFIEGGEIKSGLNLKDDQFRLIADWYHIAILSLSKIKGAQADPRWVARRLGISMEEAHGALLRLQRLGLIETKPVFRQICEAMDIVSEIPSEAIRKYHKQNLALASEKLELVSLELRQFQSLSMLLNPSSLKLFKKLIDDFLAEAAVAAESNQNPSSAVEVYNLNVQLFPVTQTKE
jgi:transcriptional regulator with XRE-family HTH domain